MSQQTKKKKKKIAMNTLIAAATIVGLLTPVEPFRDNEV